MYEAIFHILRGQKSLELLMESYLLLIELNKRYPRVCLSNADTSRSSCTSPLELVVDKEAWSPFVLGSDMIASERVAGDGNIDSSLDSAAFGVLIEVLAEAVRGRGSQALDIKALANMLLFQYLVTVLEGDFLPRYSVYKETKSWTHLRESFLNMLLGSRRITYKSLVKDCISIMTMLCCPRDGDIHDINDSKNHDAKPSEKCDTAVSIALVEEEKCTCIAVRRLLVMIMELDVSKKAADLQGQTKRADGVRTPALEIILDELTYDKDILHPFFQVFDDPKWKLELVLQYFWKYTTKPAVRTRRSNSSTDDANLAGVLKCFSKSSSAKSIIKKFSIEVSQLLLAHAFEAYLSLSSKQKLFESSDASLEIFQGSSMVEICKSIISAFQSLRTADKNVVILPFGKEALFTATTILSTKS